MSVRAHAAATHPGRKRRRNEDSYVVRPPLFAVADGMGGAQAGEVASRLAAAALEDEDAGGAAPEERVVALIEEANRRVFQRANEDLAASGMGTTMTVALVDDRAVTIGHVGDSRAYRLRDGEIEQLTDDHSLVAELVRSGKLSREDADSHPQRNVITRVLGSDPDVDVDVFTVEAEDGDLFLLCSDGLTTMVEEERIVEVFEEHGGDLTAAARALVGDANRGGGEDNITVVCFQVGQSSLATDQTQPLELDPPTAERAIDEDTLSELDGTPPIEVVEPPDAEQDGVSAEGPSWLALAVLVVVVAAILAGVLVLLGVV